MTDLAAAAKKQIEYAKKEYLSGDEKAGDEHRAKADGYIDRLAGGEGAAAAAADDAPPADDIYTVQENGYSRAAELDASAIANRNAGGNPTPEFDQYDGQAQKEGYTGVIGASGAGELKVYSVFKDGAVVAIVNGDGNTDTSALAEQYGIPA